MMCVGVYMVCMCSSMYHVCILIWGPICVLYKGRPIMMKYIDYRCRYTTSPTLA